MLSKEASTDTNTQLQANALKYFQALFTRPEAKSITITVSYDGSAGSQIVVNGSAQVPTNFLGVIGYNNLTVNGSSTAKWGTSRLRVALVLDNTGSMADDGKMTALKSATNSLLTQLQSAVTTNGDVYVSIIPFVKDVNLGASNYNSNYIYWDDAAQSDNNSWDANNGTCSSGTGSTTRAQCVANSSCSISGYNNQSSCNAAAACSNAPARNRPRAAAPAARHAPSRNIRRKTVARSNWGTWGYGTWTAGVWNGAYWTPKNHNTWNGCVEDRGNSTTPDTVNNYDTNVASPSTSIPSSLYPAEQYSACPQAVMGLNYNWSAMTTLVNNMSPERQYQPGDRTAARLAVAGRRRAIYRAGDGLRTINTSRSSSC